MNASGHLPARAIWALTLLLAAVAGVCSARAPAQAPTTQVELFASGTEGYHTFRIPSLIATTRGTLLAFCEGRKEGRGDSGDIDLVSRRSTDGGKTWGPLQVVWDDGSNTVGNPCPVVDRDSGTIFLPVTRNLGEDTEDEIRRGTSEGSREAWIFKSSNDGKSWSEPINITATVKKPDWTWYATGPGIGIQLGSGRLVVPCNHNVARTLARRSHVILSDDHGKSWRAGGVLDDDTNECQVVELNDGSLMLNMRSYHGKNRRAIAISRDAGETWSPVSLDDALVEPVCQASLIRVHRGEPGAAGRLAFSNPASTKRERLTLRTSADGGKTWSRGVVLHAGPAAYSSLALLPGGQLACLYERGERSPYERITFARFDLAALSGE